MDTIDNLLTIAEIAVALAGFAGIIATFQLSQIEHISRGRVLALSMVVYLSLGVAFVSVLPMALMSFGLEDAAVWAISSAFLASAAIIQSPFIIRNMNLQREAIKIRFMFYVVELIGFTLIIVNILNALGIFFEREFAPFSTMIMYSLFLVGWNFSRLLMRPLWKMVRERETLASDQS